jgi:hypothetical protein
MENVILASPILSDAGTFTGSLAVGDMSLQNLKAINLFQKYRTNDLSAVVNIDMLSAQSIDFISIVAHNGTASATVTIKAGTTSAASDYTSGALSLLTGDDMGYSLNSFASKFTNQNYRYWKLEFSDVSNPDGFLEMGRVYLSKCFQPNKNAIWGMEEGYRDDSRSARTVSGGISTVPRTPLKTARWQLDFSTSLEMYNQAREIDRTRGTSKDVIFIPDLDDSNYFQSRFLYGKMTGLTPIISAAFSIYRKAYELEEII